MNLSHTLKSDHGPKIDFNFRNKENVWVRLDANGLAAELEVYLYQDHKSLAQFFEKIDANIGNSKIRFEWESIEGQLSIQATPSILGPIDLEIALRKELSWEVRTKFSIDPNSVSTFTQFLNQIKL